MKKRKLLAMLFMTGVLAGVTAAAAEDSGGNVVLPAADAAVSGVTLKDTDAEKEIYYDEADNCIIGLGEFSSITYTVPEGVEGTYDIYLNISKASSAFVSGSTPVTVSVNADAPYTPSVPMKSCAMDQMGMEGEPTYQTDMGLFLVRPGADLKTDDTIAVVGVPGNEFFYNGGYSSLMPAIGDLILYPAGTAVEQGYEGEHFTVTEQEADPADPLSGLEIAWLGSSVTYGQGAQGYSMADTIAENHPATHSYKYAISGTTLANCKTDNSVPTDGDGAHGSYVYRMEQLNKDQKYDLFIVQLSTNDAAAGIPMGEISEDMELDSQDPSTVIGAMEYIIAYVRETWDCPVMFYTGTRFDSEQYAEMVESLLQLKEKWGIGVIDLWNNDEMNEIDDEQRAAYIKEDGVHPLKEGYVEWWTPEFEKAITEYLGAE